MADDFQSGICSNGGWWNTARTTASFDSMASSISCSTAITDIGGGGTGNFSWTAAELMESKAGRSCDESAGSVASGSSVASDAGPQLIDSTMQLSSFGISSPSLDWTQALLRTNGGRTDQTSYHALLQEDLNSKHYAQHDQQLHMNMNQNFELGGQVVQQQHHLSSYPLTPSSYACTPSILQGLLEAPVPENKPQQSNIYDDRAMNYQFPAVTAFRQGSSNDQLLQPSWTKFTELLKSSPPNKEHPSNQQQLQFSNNAPFWNASAAASDFYTASPSSQFLGQPFEPIKPSVNINKVNREGVRDSSSSSSTKKSNSEPAFKKPRIDTPSPLPTFKVRKEKLGDRITALQQLVSPFGKTDTASVLHEAIEYIRFLHDQVSVLSTPYLKNGNPIQQQQSSEKPKDGDGTKKDLRSRGLCLVPIASTYPVASETTADFWHPTFGGTYR